MIKLAVFAMKSIVYIAVICSIMTLGKKLNDEFTVRVEEARAAFEKYVGGNKPPKTLNATIKAAAKKYDVDPLILEVIVRKESNSGDWRSLYRFEPELYGRLKQKKSFKRLSDSEIRMLASSHGPFHILGLTGETECGIHFSHLYDYDIAANCAARIVSRIKTDSKGEVREIFKRYNGQGPKAEVYAQSAMVELASMLYQRQRISG